MRKGSDPIPGRWKPIPADNADAARRETAADEMAEQDWDSIDQRIQEIMSALTASKGKRTDEGKE